MIFKKITAAILSTAILALIPTAVLADETEQANAPTPMFYSFRGTVKEVREVTYENDDVATEFYVLTENADSGLMNLIVTQSTFFVGDEEIAVGNSITGIYDASAPAALIEPPQHRAVVVAINLPDGQSVKVDRFDENLVSSDGFLKLINTDKADIWMNEGTPFEGTLENRTLAVVYSAVTMSIPGQTTPIRIIVLPEKAVPPIMQLPDDFEIPTIPTQPDGDATLYLDDIPVALNGEIVVENEIIEAPEPFITDDGVVMVPVRAIAETLGFEVSWDEDSLSVMVGQFISFKPDINAYNFARMAPFELDTAPILVGEYTYVPLNFFSIVAKINNAYVFEGQIVVDNSEKFE